MKGATNGGRKRKRTGIILDDRPREPQIRASVPRIPQVPVRGRFLGGSWWTSRSDRFSRKVEPQSLCRRRTVGKRLSLAKPRRGHKSERDSRVLH